MTNDEEVGVSTEDPELPAEEEEEAAPHDSLHDIWLGVKAWLQKRSVQTGMALAVVLLIGIWVGQSLVSTSDNETVINVERSTSTLPDVYRDQKSFSAVSITSESCDVLDFQFAPVDFPQE